MLLRFSVANYLSFRELTEFNMSSGDVRTKKNHVESVNGIDFLKFSLIYGPNGAGKSNLIRAIETLKDMIKTEKVLTNISHDTFKFDMESKNKPISFEIEFIANSGTSFIYGVEILKGSISNEYLFSSGLGKTKDKIIFERTKIDKNRSNIVLDKKYIKLKKDRDLVDLFGSSIINNSELALTRFLDFEDSLNEFNKVISDAYSWFMDNLRIIHPESKPFGLLFDLSKHNDFLNFSNNLLENMDLGIKKIHVKEYELKSFLGEDSIDQFNEIVEVLEEDEFALLDIDVIAVKNEGNGSDYLIKKLFTEHKGNETVLFSYDEESDGTKRLIEYLTLVFEILNPAHKGIWFVDEIERSIHPYLLKELLKKLVNSENLTGQLIFTTHECNLMDLNMFRHDEIWLTEKDELGASSFSPLSDFKIRNDLDIQKGYLKGRFGAIPMLANLDDLNWYTHAPN